MHCMRASDKRDWGHADLLQIFLRLAVCRMAREEGRGLAPNSLPCPCLDHLASLLGRVQDCCDLLKQPLPQALHASLDLSRHNPMVSERPAQHQQLSSSFTLSGLCFQNNFTDNATPCACFSIPEGHTNICSLMLIHAQGVLSTQPVQHLQSPCKGRSSTCQQRHADDKISTSLIERTNEFAARQLCTHLKAPAKDH